MIFRTSLFAVAVLALPLIARADAPPESPFNAHDPEIQALKKLDWKSIDFNALDPRTRCEALLAMTAVLDLVGGKADARSELLVAYMNQNNLGEEFAADEKNFTDKPHLSYEDAQKVAAAFLRTAKGQAKFGDDFDQTPESMLNHYQALYGKTCRRKWEEVVESRTYVHSMGDFLKKKGKFEDYLQWSAGEAKKKQEQFEQERKAKQAAYVKAQEEKRAQAQTALQAKREADQQAALQRMSYAMQSQTGEEGGGYNDDDWNSNAQEWGWGTGSYYVDQTWRYNSRDNVRQAVRNWYNTPKVRPRGRR